MPMDQEQFDRLVSNLRTAAARLHGAIGRAFPEGFIFDPETAPIAPGSGDWPLHPITSAIDDVLGSFDCLQQGLGRTEADTRHRRFLCPGPPGDGR